MLEGVPYDDGCEGNTAAGARFRDQAFVQQHDGLFVLGPPHGVRWAATFANAMCIKSSCQFRSASVRLAGNSRSESHWYTNDRDGLDADLASQLAEALQARLSDGTIGRFISDKLVQANSLPDEPCEFCAGTGIRTDAVGINEGFDSLAIDEPGHPRFGQQGWCNGCGGRGARRPFAAYFPLTGTEEVKQLISFLIAASWDLWRLPYLVSRPSFLISSAVPWGQTRRV